MAVTVYVWLPSASNFGHAALKVDGGIPPGDVYFSRWFAPGSNATLKAITIGTAGANASFEADKKAEEGRAPIAVRLTYLDESAIKKKIEALNAHSDYNFWHHNCAMQVREVLNAGVSMALGMAVSLATPGLIIHNSPAGVLMYANVLKSLDRLR